MVQFMVKKTKTSQYKRYRDGLWIPSFKRTYLYWFKFLQEAEKSKEHKVDWSKYEGWGGSNEVLGSKFDDFWEENWKELFGIKERGNKPKFELSTEHIKTEAIRVSYLVWLQRNMKPLYELSISPHRTLARYEKTKKGKMSNALSISKKILASEKRVGTLNLICVWDLEDDRNPNTEKDVRDLVNRYLRNSKKIVDNVCNGQFP